MKRRPCRHNVTRTVSVEITIDGDVYQSTRCGSLTAGGGSLCGKVLTRSPFGELLGNADVGQATRVRIGRKLFSITVKDVTP